MQTFGLLEDPSAFQSQEDAFLKALATDAVRVRDAVKAFRDKLAEVRKSGHFTKDGFAARAGELAAEPLGLVAKVEGDLRDHYQPRLKSMRREVKIQQQPEVGLIAELQRQEVRRVLSQRSEVDVLAALQEAVESGDELVYRSISDAPSIYSPSNTDAPAGPFGLPIGLVELARETWASKTETSAARRVRKVEELLERLKRTVENARRTIHDLAGMELPDPLAEFGDKVGAMKTTA